MREYGKILGSIVLALFTLATVLAASTVLYDLATGKDVFAESFTLPYLVAMMGFILFGVSGSLLWYFFLRILGTAPASFLLRHALAAGMAVVACFAGFIFIFGSGTSNLGNAIVLLGFIFPVAGASLLCYWLVFYRPDTKDKNQ